MVVLYDLVTCEDLRPSPFCWRAKLALKHKRIPYEARATIYSQIPELHDGSFKTLPVIDDSGFWSGGSFNIAIDLEARYPEGPTLFPDDPRRRFVEFVESYVDTTVHPQIFPQVALSIWKQLPNSQQAYFRGTRERRLGMTLEEADRQAGYRHAEIRASFEPVRRILKQRPFLSGDEPAYCDYIVFGALKWQRLASEVALIEPGDPLLAWFEKIDEIART